MKYRMIAMDMDGTLLNSDHALTGRTAEVLKRASRAGAHVVLASGRMPCALRAFVGALEITSPLICYNGAVIAESPTERVLHQFAIGRDLAREAAALCESMDLHVQAYRDDAFYCAADNAFSRDYQAFLKGPVRRVVTGEKLSGWLTFDTPKLLAIDTPERVAECLPRLDEALRGRLKVATSQPRFIEFVSPEAGKAAALERLCAITGTLRGEVVAFGDGLNDLDMLKWAGLSCAVENAVPPVRAAADEIIPSNDEDGVARKVEYLLDQGMLGGD